MVLVDEAFSKMDETRSREVIDYLTKHAGAATALHHADQQMRPVHGSHQQRVRVRKSAERCRVANCSTRVLVDRRECNQPRIQELWARHRQSIHQQAELDFMAQLLDQGGADHAAGSR